MTRFVSVTTRPNDDAEVTMRGKPTGSGIMQLYGRWVWPVTTRSMCRSRFSAISTIGPEMPLHWLYVPVCKPPSWMRAMIALTP